jgi:phosphatidyl-myo-inositol dimannoside synthase
MASSSFLPGRGGIESYLAELCAELAPRLAVLAQAERDGRALPGDLPYPTVPYPGAMVVPTRRTERAIVAAAERFGVERILFGTPWPLALLGPRLAAHGLRYAVIVHGAEMLVPGALPGVRRKLARALAGAELLLPVSDFTAAKLRALIERAGHPLPPIERLRARVDLERFHPGAGGAEARARLGLSDEDRMVLCFGRLVRRKGIHRLIAALPELARRAPRTTLVVAGTGPQERRLRRQAERAGAPVIFAGRVPEPDAPAFYAAADVFALPVADRWFGLDTEGLGVVLLEAQACGTPCVTGASGGTTEAVLHGRTGYVVDARSPAALTEAIASLLLDPEAATRMGAAGRGYVSREFSAERPPAALLGWLG